MEISAEALTPRPHPFQTRGLCQSPALTFPFPERTWPLTEGDRRQRQKVSAMLLGGGGYGHFLFGIPKALGGFFPCSLLHFIKAAE